MVERHPASASTDRQLDAVFQALADPTRRSMLRRLADRDRTVGELAQPLAMSLAAASKHVRVLERAGLVRREIAGRTHRVHLEPAPLHAGAEWLRHYERYWNRRLDALAALLEADAAPARDPARTQRGAASRRRPGHRT